MDPKPERYIEQWADVTAEYMDDVLMQWLEQAGFEIIGGHMLSKRPKDLKSGTYQQPGANDDTTGKVWPGVHGETENPPLQPATPVAGQTLGSGSHGFRVHKK